MCHVEMRAKNSLILRHFESSPKFHFRVSVTKLEFLCITLAITSYNRAIESDTTEDSPQKQPTFSPL